MQDIYSFV